MKNRYDFLDLVFLDPAVRKSVAMSTRRRRIYTILENTRLSQLDFGDSNSQSPRKVLAFYNSFVATSLKRQFEYDTEFLEHVGESVPFIFHMAGRNTTLSLPASRFFPKSYFRGIQRDVWLDMLTVSLMRDRPDESKAMALQTIKSDTHASGTGPETLTQALEYSIITGNTAMFQRTTNLLRFLGNRGYRFEEWKWKLMGYNVLHLALLYGQVDQAIKLVTLGIDPRYPFVYDPNPRSIKPIHQRRRVIPTLDFVHILSKSINSPKIHTLVREMEAMQRWHIQHNAKMGARDPNHMNHVSGWTTHKYQIVQNKRRGSFETSKLKAWISRMLGKKHDYGLLTTNLNPKEKVTSNTINNAVSRHMRDHTLRVPNIPLNILKRRNKNKKNKNTKNTPVDPPRYLFRGVHGPIAKALRRYGTYHDKGFVATSVRKDVADAFKSRSGLMMVFKIEDLAPGTPWIWFSPHASPQSQMVRSFCDEAEVLLPPGTYTLGQKAGKNVYWATYHPDRTSMSLKGKRIM
jgi:hypothetical protein